MPKVKATSSKIPFDSPFFLFAFPIFFCNVFSQQKPFLAHPSFSLCHTMQRKGNKKWGTLDEESKTFGGVTGKRRVRKLDESITKSPWDWEYETDDTVCLSLYLPSCSPFPISLFFFVMFLLHFTSPGLPFYTSEQEKSKWSYCSPSLSSPLSPSYLF